MTDSDIATIERMMAAEANVMTTEQLDQTTAIMRKMTARNAKAFGVDERAAFGMAYERLAAEHPQVAFYWSIAQIARKANGVD